ncbi:Uncharacterised protein [Ectopseudomonas mendocina]|uniref:Uncharacterized protein n=1 Tax=Ectopseudomonas mendocina TaxID=300 RepID=A0A379PN22_ECTME|nr:hypothetical protein [Pseudomonas mendocina]SUE95766.1 Uncharacterised protein [Pseudomonas mendocina]
MRDDDEWIEQAVAKQRKSERLKRVREIATEIVTNRVAKGEVDPMDDAALRAAVIQAGRDAAAVYDAALEYLS